MNHIYRIIWSETLGTWVAVAENVKRKGKRSSKLVMGGVLIATVQSLFSVNAGVDCTNGNGVSCQSNSNGFTRTISINTGVLNNKSVGAIISGSNGSNGSNGALFVPPGGGGKGESINGVEYNIEKPDFDPDTNILKVTYKASNSTDAYEVTFTPINTSGDTSYIFDSSKTVIPK
ncbi:ESPR domain-containing protein [Acinetobacter portensis]|uniref:ESPR domain-containing protein n=1 Tax=Acinetobacter portensis TaxID=1839785 RepID=UPI0013D093DF|nr:ESPR domain-containing protein [Acinetobacter portensis]